MQKSTTSLPSEDLALLRRSRGDWCACTREVFGVRLDEKQEEILYSCQVNPRTAVRSGHARGKDFVAAVAGLCFLFLHYPSKVIMTAPTGRQVKHIMLGETRKVWQNALGPLGGEFMADGIRFADDPDWFLLGFKAGETAPEAWTGFHSPNIMVIVTEASGIEQQTFDAIEGILTGNSRLLICLNPNRTVGEAYEAFRSPLYAKFTLSCLDAPNVVAKKVVIPGQVDRDWVDRLFLKPGWVSEISRDEKPEEGDFDWEGKRYRPGDLFRVKVLGMWPKEAPDQLIPLGWIEAAQERWQAWQSNGKDTEGALRLGVDVAGMGADETVFCRRFGDVVQSFDAYSKSGHMETAGRINNALAEYEEAKGFIDTIGEGAGVYSRCEELGLEVCSVKFSESAAEHEDLTGEREFANMRAYCWWAIRDALDPKLDGKLALPPDDELTQDLTSVRWSVNSAGKIVLEKKEAVKARLGRSPDRGDALANTYYPDEAEGFRILRV